MVMIVFLGKFNFIIFLFIVKKFGLIRIFCIFVLGFLVSSILVVDSFLVCFGKLIFNYFVINERVVF